MGVKTHPVEGDQESLAKSAQPSQAWDSVEGKQRHSGSSGASEKHNSTLQIGTGEVHDNSTTSKRVSCQQRVWDFVEDPGSSRMAFGWSIWIMLLIFISTVTLVLETLPELSTSPLPEDAEATVAELIFASFDVWFWIETFCIFNFTVEFLCRFLFSPSKAAFLRSPMNVVDFFAIIPYYIEMPLLVVSYLGDPVRGAASGGGIGDLRVIRVIRLTRVFRVMKMGRYMSGATLVKDALISSSDALALLGFSMFIALIIFASGMYYLERGTLRGRLYYNVDPSVAIDFFSRGEYFNASDPNVLANDAYWVLSDFQSIPDALWWCFATVTTVGYGDIYPVTVGGKMLGTVTMFAGILMIALPTGVIGSNFLKCWKQKELKDLAAKALKKKMTTKMSTAEKLRALEEENMDLLNTCVRIRDIIVHFSPPIDGLEPGNIEEHNAKLRLAAANERIVALELEIRKLKATKVVEVDGSFQSRSPLKPIRNKENEAKVDGYATLDSLRTPVDERVSDF